MGDNIIPGYVAQNYLPKHQTMRVNGIAGARAIKMYPNCSDVLLDENYPIAYFCYTDGMGNLKVDPYDVTPHKTEEQKQQEQILTALELITRRLEKLEGQVNESDASKTAATVTTTAAKSETSQKDLQHANVVG